MARNSKKLEDSGRYLIKWEETGRRKKETSRNWQKQEQTEKREKNYKKQIETRTRHSQNCDKAISLIINQSSINHQSIITKVSTNQSSFNHQSINNHQSIINQSSINH